MVEVLAGFAIPQVEIAQALGIAQHTLLKYFATELECGAAKVHAKLAGNLLRLASGSDGTALKATMFALQTRFGWSAYVPRPAEEKPLGKKEIAQIEAERAPDDEGWSRLLQ
ncbi:MAG: hypothetical protein AB7F22_10530 [Reyranella sp.]|uniref:hypothetical protein n=1 Tax=Reyranella sp. TaxID=1929291 RepID=UPI003D0E3359